MSKFGRNESLSDARRALTLGRRMSAGAGGGASLTGAGIAGRVAEWASASELQSSTLLKTGAGLLTLNASTSETLVVGASLTLSGTDGKQLTLNTSLTVSGNDGTLSYSSSSLTLTVSGNSNVNQNLRTTDSPTFASLTLTGDLAVNGGDITSTTNLNITPTGILTLNPTGNMLISPAGDVIFDPVGNDILPNTGYDLNIGSLAKKYLTLYAAELWVETLVAQDTIATIGGRIIVAPTTSLIADVSATPTAPVIADFDDGATATPQTSLTLTIPASTAVGDSLLAVIIINGALTITTPAGWTLAESKDQSTLVHMGVYIKRAVAGDAGSNVSFDFSGSSNAAGALLRLTGAPTMSFIDIDGSQGNGSGTSHVMPSITTLSNNTRVLAIVGLGGQVNVTADGTTTEYLEVKSTSGSNDRTLEIAQYTQASAGATGTKTATSNVSVQSVGYQVAIQNTGDVIDVKHNQMISGDIALLEADGHVEFMKINSAPITLAVEGYRYVALRNQDGTGANAWYAGDAVVNTGATAGLGFIDLYSLHGVTAPSLDYVFNYNNNGAGSPFEAGVYSVNYADYGQWSPFGDGANTEVGDSVYYGVSGTTWENFFIEITTAGVFTITASLEYWNGAVWTAVVGATTYGPFDAVGTAGITWSAASQTGWATKTINGVSAYWVRHRITAFTSFPTVPVSGRAYRNKSAFGPTIAGMVRNSSTFNDWSEHWAIGNLNGLYGYSDSIYGVGVGKYSTTTSYLTADATNGLRIMRGPTALGQWQIDGDFFIGTDIAAAATTNIAIFNAAQTYNGESVAVGDLLLGDNSSAKANIFWDKSAGRLNFRGGQTVQAYIDTTGAIIAGGGQVKINSSGVTITESGSTAYLTWAFSTPTFVVSVRADDANEQLLFLTTGPSIVKFNALSLTTTKGLNIGSATGAVDGEIEMSGSIRESTLIGCRVYRSVDQLIATATFQTINFDQERYDTDTMHFTSSSALTGTVSKNGTTTLTGSGTSFTTELSVGQMISVPGTATEVRVVTAIASNTSLTVAVAFTHTASGQTCTRVNSGVVARTPGKYRCTFNVRFAANSTGVRSASIRLNGVDYIALDQRNNVGASLPTVINVSCDYNFAQWDYVQPIAYQESGGDLNVENAGNYSPEFSMARIP